MLRICSARKRHQDSASAACLDQIFPAFILHLATSSPGVSQLPWLEAQDALWRHGDGLCS